MSARLDRTQARLMAELADVIEETLRRYPEAADYFVGEVTFLFAGEQLDHVLRVDGTGRNLDICEASA